MLKKEGMEVITLSSAGLATFKAKTKPVSDKWAAEIGPDLVKAAEKIIAETK